MSWLPRGQSKARGGDVELRSYGVGPRSQLRLDGEDISRHVLGLKLTIAPGTHEQTLDLQLTPHGMDVELRDVETFVDQDTHDLLVHLGWTPPPSEEEPS
jgi:hypothetical protein